MRGSLQERSAVLHLNNKHDRVNQSLLRIRLTVVTSADRGSVMCAPLLLSRKTTFLQNSNYTKPPPAAGFCGPIARCNATPIPASLPLGR